MSPLRIERIKTTEEAKSQVIALEGTTAEDAAGYFSPMMAIETGISAEDNVMSWPVTCTATSTDFSIAVDDIIYSPHGHPWNFLKSIIAR
jgi:hypothetical protein